MAIAALAHRSLRAMRARRTASTVMLIAASIVAAAVCCAGAHGQETVCPESSIFSQAPNLGGEEWDAYISDSNAGYYRYERLQGLSGPVCNVRWWGMNAWDSGSGLAECSENPMSFMVTFYANDQNKPGAEVCSYVIDATGAVASEVRGWTLYVYEAALDSCCSLTDGWVSVVGYGGNPSCWFMWNSSSAGDDSACQRNPVSGLTCSSGLHFRDLSLCVWGSPQGVEPSTWGAIKSMYRG